MDKTVVYLPPKHASYLGGVLVLSTGTVMEILGVSKVTLYKWKDKGIITPAGEQKMGERKFHLWAEKDVEKLKKLLPMGRGAGRHLISEYVTDMARRKSGAK